MKRKLVSYQFKAYGNDYSFWLDTDKLDRDYDDEDYCYWVVERDCHVFEVNLDKDENGEVTNTGMVFAAIDMEAFDDMDYTEIHDVTIALHDIGNETIDNRQAIADEICNEICKYFFGYKFETLDNIEDDEEINHAWNYFNDLIYNEL